MPETDPTPLEVGQIFQAGPETADLTFIRGLEPGDLFEIVYVEEVARGWSAQGRILRDDHDDPEGWFLCGVSVEDAVETSDWRLVPASEIGE